MGLIFCRREIGEKSNGVVKPISLYDSLAENVHKSQMMATIDNFNLSQIELKQNILFL